MRCYNGCPDSALQAKIDQRNSTMSKARRLGISLVFFPAEEMWKAFREYTSVSKFHHRPEDALEEAIA